MPAARRNALTLENNRSRREYAPADHERFVDGLLCGSSIAICSRGSRARLAKPRGRSLSSACRDPGTTLIEQILASHSQIHGAGELRLARRSFEAIPGVLGRPARPRMRRLISIGRRWAAWPNSISSTWRRSTAAAMRGSSTRCPTTTCILVCLSVMFPRAVLHSLPARSARRGRLVLDDRLPQHPLGQRPGLHRLAVRAISPNDGSLERRFCPCRFTRSNYEETVTDLESAARAADRGLRPPVGSRRASTFTARNGPIRTASVMQVRQPVYQRSVARWKNYEPALAELFAALPGEEGLPLVPN